MKIEFIQAEGIDPAGNPLKVYRAVCLTGEANAEENAREMLLVMRELGSLNVVRRDILDLDDLQDVKSAHVLAEQVLAKMEALGWPSGLSPEALLFAAVNEAIHVLENTAADFLLTEDSPADTLTS